MNKIILLCSTLLLCVWWCVTETNTAIEWDNYLTWSNKIEENIVNYTTGTRNYEEVWFPTIATGEDLSIYYTLQKDWTVCNDHDYGIGWGRWCSNVTGYTHTYTIPKLWLKIEAYKNALPDYIDNPWIFQKNIEMPFTVVDNVITEKSQWWIYSHEYKLEYYDIKPTEQIEKIINNKIQWYSHIERKKINDWTYVVTYQEWDNYLAKVFMFQQGKNYYYIYTSPWSSCNPWLCGFNRHEVIYFTK